MFVKIPGAVPHYRFSMLDRFASGVRHAVFMRHGGVSPPPFDTLNIRFGIGDSDATVQKNRTIMQLFFEKELLDGRTVTVVSANQTHSDHVFSLHKGARLPEPLEVDDIDALVTDRSDVAFLMQVADCQPVILFEPDAKTLALVHSGWRGSVQNIIGKTVRVMADEFGADPLKIIACIGPSLGPCCCVFTDPRAELPADYHRYIRDDNHVDFWQVTRDQLVDAGVPDEQVSFAEMCTADHTDEFFSYRRASETGRFGLMAALMPADTHDRAREQAVAHEIAG